MGTVNLAIVAILVLGTGIWVATIYLTACLLCLFFGAGVGALIAMFIGKK